MTMIPLLLCSVAGLWFYTYRWNLFNPLKREIIVVDRLQRAFLYHVPKNLGPQPRLIIAYHGTGMNANLMQIFTGHEFDLLADSEKNTIIVYPQGYKNNWNDCRIDADFPAKKLNVNDVDFTCRIISFFSKKYHINEHKVYAAGFSNGGQMVNKLARTIPERFKGFAVISANIPDKSNDACTAADRPISIIIFSGMSDPIVPYHGGPVKMGRKDLGLVQSSEQTLHYWLGLGAFERCSTMGRTGPTQTENGLLSKRTDYHSKADGRFVSFIAMSDGGHTIPNRNFRIPIKVMGNMNREIDAPKLIWDFFAALR